MPATLSSASIPRSDAGRHAALLRPRGRPRHLCDDVTRPDLFAHYLSNSSAAAPQSRRAGRGRRRPQPIPLHFAFPEGTMSKATDAAAAGSCCATCSTCPTSSHRRRHRQRHLRAGPRRAAAAGAVHRAARRLFAAPAAALHGDRARAFPELRDVHQLPVLHRRVRRAQARDDRWPTGQGPATTAFVEPGNVDHAGRRAASRSRASPPPRLPQMPAYHLTQAAARRHHHGQHRRRPVQRQDHHRPHRGAAPACLADARPLRRPAQHAGARRLCARPRLCARGPRARRRPADLGADPAAGRSAGGAGGGGRRGHRPRRASS